MKEYSSTFKELLSCISEIDITIENYVIAQHSKKSFIDFITSLLRKKPVVNSDFKLKRILYNSIPYSIFIRNINSITARLIPEYKFNYL